MNSLDHLGANLSPLDLIPIRAEMDLLKEQNSKLLSEKFEAMSKVSALKLEIERLTGANPDYRAFLRRQLEENQKAIEQTSAEADRVKALFDSRSQELSLIIEEQLKEVENVKSKVAMANIVRDRVESTVRELMIQAIDQAERRKQLKTQAWGFFLGVVASLVASLVVYLLALAA